MRYTTLIDISELPSLYRNHNVRLTYMHMCLKCGYHDDDRDMMPSSIRRLAADVGVTVSAARHALAMLEAAHLVERHGTMWSVKKWQQQTAITPRATGKTTKAAQDAAAERQRLERQREQEQAERERMNAANEAQGKTNFMIWYEATLKKAEQGDLEAQRSCERNRKTYEQHAQAVKADKGKKT